jgi:hypothetical protein
MVVRRYRHGTGGADARRRARCYSGALHDANEGTNIVQDGKLLSAALDAKRRAFVETRNNKRDGKVVLKPSATVVGGVAFGRPYQSPFTVR